jgi:peptidyl-prolyl cis-trans isomerase C
MLKLANLAACAAIGMLLAAPAFSGDKVAATVNGVAIPQSRVDAMVKEATTQGQQPDSPELHKAMRERAINIELLSQQAMKDGLDKQAEVQEQIAMARQSVLVGAYIQEFTKNHPISEDTLKQEYEKLKDQPNNKRYQVAHILVVTEKEAKAIVAQLRKGGNFAAIAKKSSKDPSAKNSGGDMGWHTAGDFVPEFSEAMVRLKKGEISEPVQTQFGWHIIKLEDVQVVPFEQVKQSLMQMLQNRAIQNLLADLRKGAKIDAPQ